MNASELWAFVAIALAAITIIVVVFTIINEFEHQGHHKSKKITSGYDHLPVANNVLRERMEEIDNDARMTKIYCWVTKRLGFRWDRQLCFDACQTKNLDADACINIQYYSYFDGGEIALRYRGRKVASSKITTMKSNKDDILTIIHFTRKWSKEYKSIKGDL